MNRYDIVINGSVLPETLLHTPSVCSGSTGTWGWWDWARTCPVWTRMECSTNGAGRGPRAQRFCHIRKRPPQHVQTSPGPPVVVLQAVTAARSVRRGAAVCGEPVGRALVAQAGAARAGTWASGKMRRAWLHPVSPLPGPGWTPLTMSRAEPDPRLYRGATSKEATRTAAWCGGQRERDERELDSDYGSVQVRRGLLNGVINTPAARWLDHRAAPSASILSQLG